jgi:uncharacterized damage-inducible protein DinB
VENIVAFSSPLNAGIGYAVWAIRRIKEMDAQKALIAEFDSETAKTRKMLDAIPADADWNFKPHPKSMSLGRLAGHLTDFVGDWGNHTLTLDKLEFAADHKWEPYTPASKAELLERFDKKLAETRPALVATTGDAWDRNWKFVFGGQAWIDDTKYNVFRETVLNHMIHHRGQLVVYLRLIGAKVPGIYGPSADEM